METFRTGGGTIRWKGDLYQLGLGPKVTVPVCEWPEVCAGCEMLLGM